LAPQIEGVENIVFENAFVMGEPITNLAQVNNTFTVRDALSKVLHSHTVKVGVDLSREQVNVNPDATFNGTFLFNGSGTGSTFAVRGLSHWDTELLHPGRFTNVLSAP
jgi:hypothetical protein